MKVPPEVTHLLAGRPTPGTDEQAFPFLTIDAGGYPHVALLSRAELAVDEGRDRLLAVISSSGTRANVLRDRRAALVAVGGLVAHSTSLSLVDTLEEDRFLGCAFEVVRHTADTLGIPLDPMRFPASDHVAQLERWDVSERMLSRLARD